MKEKRIFSRFIRACGVAGLIFLAPIFPAQGAEEAFVLPAIQASLFPENPIQIVVPGPFIEQDQGILALGQYLFSEKNRATLELRIVPGKGGALALNSLLDSATDGTAAALVWLPNYYLQLETDAPMYRENEIVPVCVFGAASMALWVPEEHPATTLEEFIQSIRYELPGTVLIAGNGSATGAEMANRFFNRTVGVVTLYSPFLNQAKSYDAVRAGRAVATWGLALTHTSMSKMRPLAVAAAERLPHLPDVPTFIEAGYPFGAPLPIYAGIALSSKVEEGRRLEFSQYVQARLQSPEFVKLLKNNGFLPTWVSGKEIQAFLTQQKSAVEKMLLEYPNP